MSDKSWPFAFSLQLFAFSLLIIKLKDEVIATQQVMLWKTGAGIIKKMKWAQGLFHIKK